VLASIALILYFGAGLWLPAIGRLLIWDDGRAPADIAVVLAGDFTGSRLRGAADLVRSGLSPVVLVSGPGELYGVNEADAAIRLATAQGYPAEYFVPVRHASTSTRQEGTVLLDEMARRHVRSVNLVTSNFHTRRARRVYLELERERGGGPKIRMVAVPNADYDPAAWWRTREGRKVAFFEWTKTITFLVGI
jgi:uncharacterized SAM-binding protein YcdF (DUF218 family)